VRIRTPGWQMAVLRFVVAVAIGGVVAAVVFLIMVEGAFRKGHTTLDFNHVLGTVIAGNAEEIRQTGAALGVVGDSAGPTGLYATLIGGMVLLVVHGLVIVPLVRRRHWVIKGVALGVLTYLVLGLVYTTVADHALDTPVGLFGKDDGSQTPMVLGICSLGFGIVGARCYDLIAHTGWWTIRREGIDVDSALAEVGVISEQEEGSLELAEKGDEQGRMRA
jgi:hypothetical protein